MRHPSFIKLFPGDRHRLIRFLPVFVLSSAGNVLGAAAFMALFNGHLGAERLPTAYLLTALGLLLGSVLAAEIAGRLSQAQFNLGIFAVLTGLVITCGLLVIALPQVKTLYFVLIAASETVLMLLDMQIWSVALTACDTQQARRLFPLFTSSKVVGSVIGGALAGPLASLVGAAGVYLIWGGLLLVTTLALVPVIQAYLRLPLSSATKATSFDEGGSALLADLNYIRRSPFMLLVVGVATMLIMLFYAADYTYNVIAHARFADEAALTGFFGCFFSAYNLVALLISLSVTSRLLQRWGVGNVIVGVASLYVAAFGLLGLGVEGSMALVFVFLAYMLINIATYNIGEPTFQVLYKVVPIERRDGVRMVSGGGSALVGMSLGAALSALHSDAGLSLAVLAWVSLALAGGFALVSLWMRHLYLRALLDRLVAGDAELVSDLPSWLGRPTGVVLDTLREALSHPRANVRELALEVLTRLDVPEMLDEIQPLVADTSPKLRIASVRCMVALASSPNASAILRERVVQALLSAQSFAPAETAAAIIVGLERLKAPGRVARLAQLETMLADSRPQFRVAAVDAAGKAGITELSPSLSPLLSSGNAWLRERAVYALGKLGYTPDIPVMLSLLLSADRTLRKALIESLSQMNKPDKLLKALPYLPLHAQADLLQAMTRSDHAPEIRQTLIDTALTQLDFVVNWPLDQDQWPLNELKPTDSKNLARKQTELATLLRSRLAELKHNVCDAALTLLGTLTGPTAMQVIRQHLDDDDPETRSNALEALDGLGERQLSAALAATFQATDLTAASGVLENLRQVPDIWVKACTARLKPSENQEDKLMSETLEQTLNLDRVLTLKQVPLFAELSVNELQVIAAFLTQVSFSDGEFLMRQGERGDRLFILLDGQAQVLVKVNNEQKTVAVLGAGEVVGEMSLIDDAPRNASVAAVMDIETLSLQRAAFRRLLYQYPEIADGLLRQLARRLRIAMESSMS